MKYVVVTNRCAEQFIDLPGFVRLIRKFEFLTPDNLSGARYVFFPFWSHKVPKEITDNYECVCFHMTDVPYGRGGSPLQNLILRGHTDTVISALRMTEELDAGPVYMKRPLSLSGSAQEIYERAARVIADMMREIADTEPKPVPQTGDVVMFRRRTPVESELPAGLDLKATYDFIRMLDADGYPRAFVRSGDRRIELSGASLGGNRLTARVVIR